MSMALVVFIKIDVTHPSRQVYETQRQSINDRMSSEIRSSKIALGYTVYGAS